MRGNRTLRMDDEDEEDESQISEESTTQSHQREDSHSWIRAYSSSKSESNRVNIPEFISAPVVNKKKTKSKTIDSHGSLVPVHEFQAQIPCSKTPKLSSSNGCSLYRNICTSDKFDNDIIKNESVQSATMYGEEITFRASRKTKMSADSDVCSAIQKSSPVHWNTPVDPVCDVGRLEQPSGGTLSILGSSVNKTPSVAAINPNHYTPEHVSSPISRRPRASGLRDLSIDETVAEEDDDLRMRICADSYFNDTPGSPMEVRIQDKSMHSSHYMTNDSQNIINSYVTGNVPLDISPVHDDRFDAPSPPSARHHQPKEGAKSKHSMRVVVPKLDVRWAGEHRKQQRKLRRMFAKPQKPGRKDHLPVVVGCSNTLGKKHSSVHSPLNMATYYMSMDGSVAIGEDGSSTLQHPPIDESDGSIMDYSVVKAGVKPLENYHSELNDLLSCLDDLERDSARLKYQVDMFAGSHVSGAQNEVRQQDSDHKESIVTNKPFPRLLLHRDGKVQEEGELLLSLSSRQGTVVPPPAAPPSTISPKSGRSRKHKLITAPLKHITVVTRPT